MDATLTNDIKRLHEIIGGAERAVLFTGAGFSVPSGIPDFRSAGGIYDGEFAGYSAEYMLSHECLTLHPDLFFDFYKSHMLYPEAKPNAAHFFFAELERKGKLLSVVTQNIDGLHQAAGSKRVWELHGSVARNRCEKCGARYDEAFDQTVLEGAIRDISRADVLIVAGTSLAVYPAAMLPDYFRGRELVLVNKTPTARDGIATLAVYSDIAEVFGGEG